MSGRRGGRRKREREGAERQAGRPAGNQAITLYRCGGDGNRRRRRRRREKEEADSLASSLIQRDGGGPFSPPSLAPPCTPTKISTTTTKSVLSMNDGRIDHNFRRRESIRGSADSGRHEDEEAGGGREGSRREGRKRPSLAKRAGKLKRGGEASGVGGEGGRSRRRKRSQVGWKWRGGIKGARGVRKLDSMEKNITWLILQAPPITLGPGSPARPVFRRDLTKYVADSFVGSAG